MPLTPKDEKILDKLRKEYGSDAKAKHVFYGGINKGTIKADHPKTTKAASKKK